MTIRDEQLIEKLLLVIHMIHMQLSVLNTMLDAIYNTWIQASKCTSLHAPKYDQFHIVKFTWLQYAVQYAPDCTLLPVPLYALKCSPDCTQLHSSSLIDLLYAPKYLSITHSQLDWLYAPNYALKHAGRYAPNCTRLCTPSLLGCTLPSTLPTTLPRTHPIALDDTLQLAGHYMLPSTLPSSAFKWRLSIWLGCRDSLSCRRLAPSGWGVWWAGVWWPISWHQLMSQSEP